MKYNEKAFNSAVEDYKRQIKSYRNKVSGELKNQRFLSNKKLFFDNENFGKNKMKKIQN